MKRPAFQFYPGDWWRSSDLRSCSIAARGLWMDMLCYMHDCEPYGHLATNGRPVEEGKAARIFGLSLGTYRTLLAEIEEAGVSSRTGDGILYSRRLVRDGEISKQRAIAGANSQQNRKQPPQQSAEGEDEVEATPPKGVPKGEGPTGFLECWALYPRRPNNSKERALKAYAARLKEGVDPAAILDGVKRYALYVRVQKTEPQYIKQAATFFGPDRHWESDYSAPRQTSAPKLAYHEKYKGPVREPDVPPEVKALFGDIGKMPGKVA